MAAFRTVQVRAQASGVILARPFTEGAQVRAGDTLYRIDPTAADADARKIINDDVTRKLYFVDYAETVTTSATAKQGLDKIMTTANRAHAAAFKKLPTPKLTRALQEAMVKQQPPRAGTIRPKLRYAHQGGSNPPVVVIHGTSLNKLSDMYTRYLERFFLDYFELKGTPVRLELRTGHNPYAEDDKSGRRKR